MFCSKSLAVSRPIFCLVLLTGIASLSWEVLWQVKSTLALGVSALGTAITLAVTMGGMAVGSFVSGFYLKTRQVQRPLTLYGFAEAIVGLAGLFLAPGFRGLEILDTRLYAASPYAAVAIHIAGIVALLGVPTMAMGATLPVFGLIARGLECSIATLYGLNTLGAALGALIAAFVLIPALGLLHTAWALAGCNFLVAALCLLLPMSLVRGGDGSPASKVPSGLGPRSEALIVVVTGTATFMLEISWFRSLTAAFHSTTDAFAVMLASLLLALGLAAQVAPVLKRKGFGIGPLLASSGIAVLIASPLLERFDLISPAYLPHFAPQISWFLMSLYVIGPPILLLGLVFPWVMDAQIEPRRWASLYMLNTGAAICGSLGAAWILLPLIGAGATAWVAGGLVAATGIAVSRRVLQLRLSAIAAGALIFAVGLQSGVGTTRVQGQLTYPLNKPSKVLKEYEGPEATVSALEYENGSRALIVDGFYTASQVLADPKSHEAYMRWMGRLPMLLHPDPRSALVICFGTGQTSDAVRQENPESLDIVDINPRVFRLAPFFSANHNVLKDPRVTPIVMDGRAFIRRTQKSYDVITLEPMPPNFAGVNALYSTAFYQFARQKLTAKGVIAQWVPFHMLLPKSTAAIVRTFRDVFPNSILWIDPNSTTGILIGSKDEEQPLGSVWPGFSRNHLDRGLSDEAVKGAVLLNSEQLGRYAALGEDVTDDNQLLAYGKALGAFHNGNQSKANFAVLNSYAGSGGR